MNTLSCFQAILLLSIISFFAHAQENIPIGTFRLHVSYNFIHDIAFNGSSQTFAATRHGILMIDRTSGETTTYSKADGLSGGTITNIDPRQGSGVAVFNRATGMSRLLTERPGQGALPSQTVYDLCLDREGAMWIGSASGVSYIPNASATLQFPTDALVWETRANGSTATWNLFDDRGRRVPSGVYVVFMVSDDGDQHEVGKLAVIN